MELAGTILFGVVGGLGLFLYGMQLMGGSLQKVAGRKLEKIIGLLTTNRFMGVFVGAFVTAVMQSSSATTVMVVGFVNAGIMKLTQAVGVIMGANIGTTITGQIVSLSIDEIAPLSVGIGMFIWIMSKSDRVKNIAEIMIGLGILFIGMSMLKDSLKPLRELEYFNTLITTLSHNAFLGVLVGFMLTFIVQSSSASISILIALASAGALPLSAALPILYGDNIGTCTTALLSSIGASKNAKRAAIIHLAFNVVGTLLFVVFLTGPITYIVTRMNPVAVQRQIANAHTIFNIANVVIQFPFAFFLVKFALWVYPDSAEVEEEKITKYIDDRLLGLPSTAINSTREEIIHMGWVAHESLTHAMSGYFDSKESAIEQTYALELKVNHFERVITEYMIKLSNCKLSDEDRSYVDGLFHCVNDVERIGDHADNIAEIATAVIENDVRTSEKSRDFLKIMYDKTILTLELALGAIGKPNQMDVDRVLKLEKEMDDLQREARKMHLSRLNTSEYTTEAGVYYLEVINNLERVSDLSANLAKFVGDQIR